MIDLGYRIEPPLVVRRHSAIETLTENRPTGSSGINSELKIIHTNSLRGLSS